MQGREGESIPRSSFERAKIGILCPVFDPKHVPNNWTQTNSQRLTVPFQQQFPNSYAADGLNGSRLPFHTRFRWYCPNAFHQNSPQKLCTLQHSQVVRNRAALPLKKSLA